jgi:hypothetical protein
VNGDPYVFQEVRYPFTETCTFGSNWSPSVASCVFTAGTTAVVKVLAYTSANPTGVQVGSITFTATGNGQQGIGAFSSTNTSTVFEAGDQLALQFTTTNLAQVSVGLRGSYS